MRWGSRPALGSRPRRPVGTDVAATEGQLRWELVQVEQDGGALLVAADQRSGTRPRADGQHIDPERRESGSEPRGDAPGAFGPRGHLARRFGPDDQDHQIEVGLDESEIERFVGFGCDRLRSEAQPFARRHRGLRREPWGSWGRGVRVDDEERPRLALHDGHRRAGRAARATSGCSTGSAPPCGAGATELRPEWRGCSRWSPRPARCGARPRRDGLP